MIRLNIRTPNRMDLAGGTTDLYPLYLFMGGGYTANVAITVLSTATMTLGEGTEIRIVSEDLQEEILASEISDLPDEGPLALVARAVRLLPPPGSLNLLTRNTAPAGSGLGASSALLIALLAGLSRLRGEHRDFSALVELAMNVETAAIGVPAGRQDYIAACFGGVSLLTFDEYGFSRQSVPPRVPWLADLGKMMILCHTGGGRFSGANNWEVVKRFIDRDPGVRHNLVEIRNIARRVGEALMHGALQRLPELIDQEWTLRRELAPEVSSPHIDGLMDAARAAGAEACKVCGAGGGGCMIVWSQPAARAAVERALATAGGTVLPFEIAHHGMLIEEQPAEPG